MHRLIRPVIAATLLLASAPLYSASGAPAIDDLRACSTKDQVEFRKDRWITIKAPKTDASAAEGKRAIVDYTTAPMAHSRIYATNGTVVKVSSNAGCTWSTMFRGLINKVRAPQTTQDVFTNLAAPTDTSLWVASHDDVSGATKPHVYVATDLTDDALANPQFVEVTTGMPQVGKPVALVGSTMGDNLVYLLVEGPPDPTTGDALTPARRLYVTKVPSDPPHLAVVGLMWQEVPLPRGFSRAGGIAPAASGRGLWAWAGKSYAFLEDSHAAEPKWTVRDAADEIVTLSVNRANEVVLALKTSQGGVAAAVAGDKLVRKPLPTVPTTFTHGRTPGVYFVSGPRGSFGFDLHAKRWIDITPKGVPPFTRSVMAPGLLSRIVLAQAGDAFYRFDTYQGERFLPPPPIEKGAGHWRDLLPRKDLKEAELTPLKTVVNVKPGELRDVPVTFRMPASATPLDVYFLVDTTASMDAAILGLRESVSNIAQQLRSTLGKDACFGVGEFRDFILSDTQNTYRRRLPITCENDTSVPKVKAALAQLDANGGGDIPEAQTIALTQSVTGVGSVNPPVTAGQSAGFRPHAFKVIVLISDSDFKRAPNYPTIESTVQTLNVPEVKVVSVLVAGNGDVDAARRDMEAVARGTETFAPNGGVDCDGDNRMTGYDLATGDPLVCDTSGSEPNIGPAIVGLLLGVSDPGTVAVDVYDDYDVVQDPIRGATSAVKNLKLQSAIGFALPVRCSSEQDGQDLPVGLVPSVRAVPVGIVGEVVVRCRSSAVVPPRPLGPRPDPVEPPYDPPRVNRPPVAIALPQPPPAPAQPISNMNLNAGMSHEEEQQFQLAAVTQGAGEEQQNEETFELAMSDYRERDAAAAGAVFGGATLMSAAATVAYRRRLRTQRSVRAGYVRSR